MTTMPIKAINNQPLNEATNSSSSIQALPDPPYSIFDRPQKWLIVALVSTAATCKSVPEIQAQIENSTITQS